MSSYSDFAYFYDSLMSDVDYKARSEYILSLFKKFGKKPTLLLDLACGTGGFSTQMAKQKIEVIAVDMSEDMLSVAREKSASLGLDILYLCQRAEELDLYGTVDGAVCCMDSINHITDKQELLKAFEKVSLFLEKDSLFIFDCNTTFKHKNILADNTFVIEEDNIFCVWQNEYCEEKNMTDISLDFFVLKDGAYERYSEEFSERAYETAEIKEMLEKAGFSLVAVFDDMSQNPPKENSERVFFAAKKL